MQKIQKIFKALSMKNALNVLMLIYASQQAEYYITFDELVEKSTSNPNTLRRITNSLSRNKIIKCVRDENAPDRRRKVYKCNKEIVKLILELQK